MQSRHLSSLTRLSLIRVTLTRALIPVIALMVALTGVVFAGPVLNEGAIEDAVVEELLHDPAVPAFRITVDAGRGVVELSGTVDNILAKDRALRIAETVKGVRSVVNRIQVEPFEHRSDARIRKDAIDALMMDPATDPHGINVSVVNRKVTLRGRVDSFRERALAGTVVKSVAGVEAVDNQIEFHHPDARTDDDILADIAAGLKWDVLVDHGLIRLAVEEGRVSLSGTVGSAAEKRRALSSAWVQGVTAVDGENLAVARWARDPDLRQNKYLPTTDPEIREAVIMALTVDPRIDKADVHVAVSGGTVTLRGTVDNLKSSRSAARDAANTVGVRRVRNHLKVNVPAEQPADRELVRRIEAAFERDAYVKGYEVHVDVRDGVADLYGRVDTYFEKVRAEDLAGTVAGIYVVDNDLLVTRGWHPYYYNPYVDATGLDEYPWYGYEGSGQPRRSDLEIRQNIESELWWSPFVSSDEIAVRVDGGRATLTGQVDSKMEYDAAAENAREGGAQSVDNELVISPLLHPKKN